ncbi:hypothetical protein [Paraburkholderia sp. DHOC27]|uniref:hypothetical protein n=1 Tax=Paraburkholderia sp. DHOC27 TaxID=2303330 RepID=UPI000E3EC2B3|nr:hypothetical protein [Paraburkholderia sp. DHOC27]RFU49158.1 hypothetical protein D0B32_04930 [Paraburkholderia sp. DHOC27]
MKRLSLFSAVVVSLFAVCTAHAQSSQSREEDARVVTASNTAVNELLVYKTDGSLAEQVRTGGVGGVSGNAGGIAQNHDLLAVVNFGSKNVSVFGKDASLGLHLIGLVPAVANPVSVVFHGDHLYILTTTHVESHLMSRFGVDPHPDGEAALVVADGSAAQVGAVDGQLVISEKTNVIETVDLNSNGAVAGSSKPVANIPANVNAPFGLVTRGDDAYVTIAHANEISLVRNDAVLTVTDSGTQQAPCWVTLDGPFLFSSNSPSHSVSRYAVYGQKIVQDAAVVATFQGNPADIVYRDRLAAVVDANGVVSHVSIFDVDGDGNFTLKHAVTINNIATNGIAILRDDSHFNF